jgi:hypothetical protein
MAAAGYRRCTLSFCIIYREYADVYNTQRYVSEVEEETYDFKNRNLIE